MVISFIKGKEYIFSKEEALKDKGMRERYNADKAKWIDVCDGKLVKVMGRITGGIMVDDIICAVVAEWCNEVK